MSNNPRHARPPPHSPTVHSPPRLGPVGRLLGCSALGAHLIRLMHIMQVLNKGQINRMRNSGDFFLHLFGAHGGVMFGAGCRLLSWGMSWIAAFVRLENSSELNFAGRMNFKHAPLADNIMSHFVIMSYGKVIPMHIAS